MKVSVLQKFSLSVISLMLMGCASMKMHTSPAILSALEPTASIGTSIDCQNGCTTEWQRAQLWLAKHSVMKIQTATDVLLQTYNADGLHESFTVTKEPLSTAGSYRIRVEAVCVSPIDCAPTEAESSRALLYYVKTGTDVLEGVIPSGASIR